MVKVFGCRPLTNGAAHSGDRRTKTSKGRKRGKVYMWRELAGYIEDDVLRRGQTDELVGQVHRACACGRLSCTAWLCSITLTDASPRTVAKRSCWWPDPAVAASSALPVPEQDTVLDRNKGAVDQIAGQTNEEERGEHVGAATGILHRDNVVADAGVASDHFRRHDGDEGEAKADAKSGEDVGKGRGQQHAAERAEPRHAERRGNPAISRLDRKRAVERVDEDREEHGKCHDRYLHRVVEAEKQDEW